MPRVRSWYACRVCGCREDRACLEEVHDGVRLVKIACSWVDAEKGSPPLCSACAGTEGDMAEAIQRGLRIMRVPTVAAANAAVRIGKAALHRRRVRAKQREAWNG